ncbi:MAG TPA: alpha/beta hydrolase [Polyangia bacterium]|nr:alpha/beta hydrolase [Polyangia bacterium]
MRALARWLSIVLTVGAAALAALVVLPAPTQPLAFLAVLVDEKTPALALAAFAGLVLSRYGGSRRWMVAQAFFTGAIAIVAAIPLVQAGRLASERHAPLDLGRYLTAWPDTAPARPASTVKYATVDGVALALDVYRPAVAGRVPAIVVVHGGGWSAGDKGEAPRASAWLAAHGFAVFDVQYRLAPPPSWRAAVGDVKCAVGWVKRHARDAGVDVDPERVTLLGRSAGGHLALLAAYAPDDPELPASCDAGDTRVASVISYYGLTDLPSAWDHPTNPRVFDTRARIGNYAGGTPATQPTRLAALSPAQRLTRTAPPTLLVHGGRDQIVRVEQSTLLDGKLAALGVPRETLVIPYAQHAFDFIAGGLGAQLAEDAVLRFVHATR